MSTLPPEIISEILFRLPVKSLLRFRCTTKDFCSTIDAPDFTKLHLRHSSQTLSNQSLILTNCALRSVDLHFLERSVELEHPMKTLPCKPDVIGSCNGLLCLYNSDTEIVLWNMSTRKHHQVPFSLITFPQDPTAHYTHQIAYGFGYDSVHDDYKLVRIVRFLYTAKCEVMVYSLKSNSWKEVDGLPLDFHSLRSMGMLADGALYWLTDVPGRNWCLISAFNLAAEEFRYLPLDCVLPSEESEVELQVGVWESHFCVITHRTGKWANMYVLKMRSSEYGISSLSITQPQVTGSPHCVLPVAHSSNGDEVLLLMENKEFLWYDIKSKKVKNVTVHGLPNSFDAMLYVDSLVNPLPAVNRVDETVEKAGVIGVIESGIGTIAYEWVSS